MTRPGTNDEVARGDVACTIEVNDNEVHVALPINDRTIVACLTPAEAREIAHTILRAARHIEQRGLPS